ncbi:hypothetical protein MMC16_002475 [Acarospora aff. strigata]|nr:hypothetical protein [Acarospora aff. strigata]
MSYPPPPGLKTTQAPPFSSQQPHSSLPPRPPPPAGPPPSFKPAFTATPIFSSGAPGTRGYNGGPTDGISQPNNSYTGFTGFQPRSVAAANPSFHNHSPVVSAPPAPPTGFSAPQTGYSAGAFQPQPQSYQQLPQATFYQPSVEESYGQSNPPQIRNPFPLPGQEATGGFGRGRGIGRGGNFQDGGVDPEMEAQIAQWQSAYAGKDADTSGGRSGSRTIGGSRFGGGGEGALSASGANAGPLGGRPDIQAPAMSSSDMASAVSSDTGVAAVVNGADGKQKTVVRSGGGQTWQDPTLLEWDPAHFRLFVGNLAGEVTDESLLKAFSKFNSVQKARVVRDKRTTKSKGFGFVSFGDGEEYFQAARDMQGKYIGSHPVLLRKSTTEIRPVVPGNKKGGKGGKGGGGHGGNGGKTGAGVQKKQSKTKGGLKVLG